MKKIIRIEIDENLAETVAIFIVCITAIITVSFIDIKNSETIEIIEQRLEKIENTQNEN